MTETNRTTEMPTTYDPKAAERKWYDFWMEGRYFEAGKRPDADPYTIVSRRQNLFLGKQQDDHEFRKLRLCIVQRDETLETIAGRYQLNPREIVLYNRLSANNVSEGQVLMIP